ncbi:MAG: hypothetical protein ACKPKO_64910, partial [Candidatus Fonsibacter sp.]
MSSLEKETSEYWTGNTTFLTSTSSGSYSSDSVMPKTTIVDRDDFASSRPWDGDKPLVSRYAGSPNFIRRGDGIWCPRDAIGRLYIVNACGDRCSKPKVYHTSSGKYDDQRRPDEVSSQGDDEQERAEAVVAR